jgi:hypothetical protein
VADDEHVVVATAGWGAVGFLIVRGFPGSAKRLGVRQRSLAELPPSASLSRRTKLAGDQSGSWRYRTRWPAAESKLWVARTYFSKSAVFFGPNTWKNRGPQIQVRATRSGGKIVRALHAAPSRVEL